MFFNFFLKGLKRHSSSSIVPKIKEEARLNDQLIYTLKLYYGKIYVGATTSRNFSKRLLEHQNGLGAFFTRMFHYEDVTEIVPKTSIWDEDNKVKELMLRHGIENVRGGSYSQIILSKAEILVLKKELYHAEGKCLNCGGIGHFIMQCKLQKNERLR
jgi:predicted GIY-YIG superfamily endonuclease